MMMMMMAEFAKMGCIDQWIGDGYLKRSWHFGPIKFCNQENNPRDTKSTQKL